MNRKIRLMTTNRIYIEKFIPDPLVSFSIKLSNLLLLISFILTGCQTGQQPLSPFALDLPADYPLTIRNSPTLSVSPDGNFVVYAADIGSNEGRQLILMSVKDNGFRFLEGTQGAEMPFYSDDGQWIGFFADNKLKKVSLVNGAVVELADATAPKGGSWGKDNTIVYSTGSIWQIPGDGGTPVRLTRAPEGEQQYWPGMHPDGKTLIYNRLGQGMQAPDITLHSLEDDRNLTVTNSGSYPRISPSGQLVYIDRGSLKSVSLDTESLTVNTKPTTILENVLMSSSTGAGQYSFSNNGTLVYVEGKVFGSARRIVSIDQNGVESDAGYPLERYGYVRYSPNGEYLAIESEPDILVYEVSTKTIIKKIERASYPVWGPGVEEITFHSSINDIPGIYKTDINTGRDPELVLTSPFPIYHSYDWSPARTTLAFTEIKKETGMDIWTKPDDVPARVMLNSNDLECCAVFSPHGEWIAYVSGRPGEPQVYLISFPLLLETYQVSPDGGREPMWSADGSMLYYWEGRKLQTVDISYEPTLSYSLPQTLFEGIFVSSTSTWRPRYDIHPDGKSIIIIRRGPEELGISHINWAPRINGLITD